MILKLLMQGWKGHFFELHTPEDHTTEGNKINVICLHDPIIKPHTRSKVKSVLKCNDLTFIFSCCYVVNIKL